MSHETTDVDFNGLYQSITRHLQAYLPKKLTYHTASHAQIFLDTVEKLAVAEHIGKEEMVVLKTAVLFYDTGFLHTYKEHEAASCEFARSLLPAYGYTIKQSTLVCGLIMATKFPQQPLSILEELICDAHHNYVGTNEFEMISNQLFEECKAYHTVKTEKQWQKKQLRFLSAHRFYTASAQLWYSERKAANRTKLLENRNAKSRLRQTVHDTLLIASGVLIAAFGLKSFLLPNLFFDGGITGISMLTHELTDIPLPLTLMALNLPFIIFGYFSVSKAFACKAFASVMMLSLCLLFIPFPKLTSDNLLISVFGGVFLGIGVGLSMRAGGALDGIEVLALYTFKKTSFSITEIILAINVCIFGAAAFKFGIQTAFYSVLTYFVASRTIDYIIEGIQAYTGVTIISGESQIIKHQLVHELGRGITVYHGQRGFLPGNYGTSADCDIIFTVVTRLEMRKLKNVVYKIDPKAFVFAHTIREASGGVINRKVSH